MTNSTNDVPPAVIEAEQAVFDWGSFSPVSCLEAGDDGPAPREWEMEFHYHRGKYDAAASICNRLYDVYGIDRDLPSDPPWVEGAIAYRNQQVGGEDW